MLPRDTVDFAIALALGALVGWTVTTVLRSEGDSRLGAGRRGRKRRRSRRRRPTFVEALREDLGKAAREAGGQLASTALRHIGQAADAVRSNGGR